MIFEDSVRAGTVLHFDFRALRGKSPEFYDKHPAVVISPTVRQRDRTVIVVPLTSEVANASNASAVEIFHADLNRLSPTRRTFAICNLPVALALRRPSLDYYRSVRHPLGGQQPHFEIRGEDLSRIRAKVVEQLYTATGLRSDSVLQALTGAALAEPPVHVLRSTRSVGRPLRSKHISAGLPMNGTSKVVIKAGLQRRLIPFAVGPAGRLSFPRSSGPLPPAPRPAPSGLERPRRP